MSFWANSAANALAPYREGANAYVTSTGPPYSKGEKEKLGIEPKEPGGSQTTPSSSAAPTTHLSPAPSNTATSGLRILQVHQAGPSNTQVKRLSGQFNAPTEAEIETTKKHKGWRKKWQKLREYQRPDKSQRL